MSALINASFLGALIVFGLCALACLAVLLSAWAKGRHRRRDWKPRESGW